MWPEELFFARGRTFEVEQGVPPLQGGVSDTVGVPNVLAARVPEQRYPCVPL